MINNKLKRILSGKVVGNKMAKTVTVLIEKRLRHPLYGKYITRSKKYHAHTETDQLKIGDDVLIQECRPLSKTKNWIVLKQL
ncbi:MAG: 30S ribosomal protein S17 [Nitrosomonas sp.]|nr:MAG: 30S ribosomal protein S17 [Nitrosomonas sp.]